MGSHQLGLFQRKLIRGLLEQGHVRRETVHSVQDTAASEPAQRHGIGQYIVNGGGGVPCVKARWNTGGVQSLPSRI
eukprot:2453225-Amphidinium_carterae.1